MIEVGAGVVEAKVFLDGVFFAQILPLGLGVVGVVGGDVLLLGIMFICGLYGEGCCGLLVLVG